MAKKYVLIHIIFLLSFLLSCEDNPILNLGLEEERGILMSYYDLCIFDPKTMSIIKTLDFKSKIPWELEPPSISGSVRWSPNGKMIAIQLYGYGVGGFLPLWIMDNKGNLLRNIGEDKCCPVWITDSRICYAKDSKIYIQNLDGTGKKTVFTYEDTIRVDVYPVAYFKKDNKLLIGKDVYSQTKEIKDKLITLDINTNEINSLPVNHSWGNLSPDETKIVFLEGSYKAVDIYIFNINNGNIRNITNEPGIYRTPLWSPDGNKIAFIKIVEKEDTITRYHHTYNYIFLTKNILTGETINVTETTGLDESKSLILHDWR